MAGRYAAAGIVLALALAVTLNAQGRWYPPYERGVKAVNAGRWEEGIGLLEQAVAIDSRTGPNKYVEGVFRADYFPFAFLTIACFRAGQFDKARAYLERARGDPLPRPLAARLDLVQQELDRLRKPSPSGDKPVVDRPPADKPSTEKLPGEKPAVVEKPAAGDKTPPPGRLTSVEKPVTGKTTEPAPRPPVDPSLALVLQAVAEAQTAFDQGRYPDAVVRAKEALARNPGNATATAIQRSAESRILVAEGLALASRGLYREAEVKFEVAATRDPGNSDAATRLARSRTFSDKVRQAQAAEQRGNMAGAKIALNEAASLDRPRFEREGLGRRLDAVVAALGEAKPEAPTAPATGIGAAEADALRQALRAILGGDGALAITVLDAVLPSAPTDTVADLHMRAYLAVACAIAALSSSDPEESRRLRERGAVEFARVLEVRPDFTLPDRLISPRVLGLLKPPPAGR